MLSARTITGIAVWSIAGAAALPLSLFAAPVIEAAAWPVIDRQSVEFEVGDRTSGRMCWTWRWYKRRYAQPIVTSWAIQVDGTAVEFPTVVQREESQQVLRNPTAAPLGWGYQNLCTPVPTDLDRAKGVVIRGQINYRMPHNLWTLWYDMPPVIVPPVP